MMTGEVVRGFPYVSGMERRLGKLPKRLILLVSHPVAIQQQNRNRPTRVTELAASPRLPKDVTHLIVEPESIVEFGGAPRTAPPKSGPSGKPGPSMKSPGGNLPKGKK